MRTMGFKNLIFYVLFLVFGTIVVANQARQLLLAVQEPFSYVAPGAWVDPYDVDPGQPLHVHFKFNRNRYCGITLNFYVYDFKTNTVVYRWQSIGGGATLSEPNPKETISSYPIPVLPSGYYDLRMISDSLCNDGHHIIEAPNAAFHIN